MKRRALAYTPLLLFIFLMVACVTEFQPDAVSIPPSLIVEGQITDQPGPYSVKLTRSADYSYTSLNLLETGATVTIEDNLGNRETLKETTAGGGIYQTSATGIRGVVGRSYKLTIQTKAGKKYESEPEVLPPSVPIQKLYYEYTKEAGVINTAKSQGWNVYIDAKDPETTGNYYRWDWVSYEFTAVCYQRELPNGTLTGLGCCSNCWNINRCYTCINVTSDVNVNGNAIGRQFIMRVPYKSKGRYYLEVQQQSISKGAYEFWKSVKGLVNNTGGLFDTAPATVRGNLRCTNDPATAVYGYFGATGLSEQYINVDRSDGEGVPDLDPIVNIPQPSACVVCENSIYRTPNQPRWWQF
ncbi:DUF4249 domain-containing protein [Spirosoma sp. BT702]|uniref:DUF4249 domain-containing protein n=1 Tax=Spirosoma profusum TaxID=2771354 RepID=A0A926Y3B2_9BACT|nr:DUF4249 domain-containing protein [Spirosoma profusum]MBD2703233.1 DUF4249 domain-containing protein [Spirosoma profusum]